MESKQQKMTYILIGNPGAGKSTILNGFLQAPKFKSGFSLGPGMTLVLDRQTDIHGNAFIDTPGLSDIKMRKQASEEIVKALKFGGLYKIFFVLTLEDGRIKPDDKTTMSLVLSAASEIQHSYSIIINKVSAEVKEAMADPKQFSVFLAYLNENLPGTSSVFVLMLDLTLISKKDVVPDLPPEILYFVRDAPVVSINPEKVNPIKEDTFDAMREMMELQLQALKDNEKLMNERLAKQDEQFREMVRIQQQKDEQHYEEIKANRDQMSKFQSQMLEQQKQFHTRQLEHEKEINTLRFEQERQQNALAEKQRQHEIEMLRLQEQMLIKQGQERRKLEERAAARENHYKLERAQLLSTNQQIASKLAALSQIPLPRPKGCFGYGSRLIRKEKQREEDSNDFKRTQVVRIEEILSGDEVLTIDEIGNPCWDNVVLTDENLDAKESRVKMIEIVCQGFENYPLLLTDHHFIFILKESEKRARCMIPAREVQIGDSLMIYDDTKTSIGKVVRVRELFSKSNLLSPSYTPLARVDSATRKKWIFKAVTVSFDIQLLDATRIQGIAVHLEEFQIQYYLRNDLWLQLYGHYHKSDRNIYHHSSGNRNSILLFDEKFTTQNLVKDTTTGKALMILFLCNNHYDQEQISSLSLKLRAKSTILHQIMNIEVLEFKTYNKK